ncbi:MAG: ABC transporter permease [Candidatus Cloacimonetes bacterium]|nr:ABC transporter permease [Candidatus Cloacimonadota bacterium]
MRLLVLLKIALKSILKNKMRSFLTSLGIIIGVCSVIVMVGVGQGSQQKIEDSISSLGTNLILVFPNYSRVGGVTSSRSSRQSLKADDPQYLAENGEFILAASGSIRSRQQVVGGDSNWNTEVEGVDPGYLTIKSWAIESGTFFTERDNKSKKKVCVLGKTVADALFPNTDAVGQRLRIGNKPFMIIGVLTEKGETAMGNDQDDIILAPTKTVLTRLRGRDYLNQIYVSAINEDAIEAAQAEVTYLLQQKHGIEAGEADDFIVRTQTEITDMASETSKTLTLLLAAIAGVSLVVGGIGIMNIMLVSVTERTREIGIRLAIGARSNDVLRQFLYEAITLSLAGGFLGIMLAFGISSFMNRFTEINTVINPQIVMVAALFSGAVGIFFGYYPARKAARLNPIDALRYE